MATDVMLDFIVTKLLTDVLASKVVSSDEFLAKLRNDGYMVIEVAEYENLADIVSRIEAGE